MSQLLARAMQGLRRGKLAALGVAVGPGCKLGPAVRVALGVRDGRRGVVRLGPHVELQSGSILEAWGGAIVLGTNVFVGPYAVFYGHGGVEVGEQTLISMHCCILSSNHAIPPRGTDIRSRPDALLPTRIGRDVWLGAGAIVLGGVAIGDGCVVGAGAVVAHDLPAYSVAVGVPARVIRGRPPGPESGPAAGR